VTQKLTATLRCGALVLTVIAAGCASTTATPAATPAPPQSSIAPPTPATATAPSPSVPPTTTAEAAADELPEGKGKQILLASCTACHDLREVTKFRGFYTRAQWHDIVLTMVDYGAPVAKTDIEVLADYLAEHLGRRATASTP